MRYSQGVRVREIGSSVFFVFTTFCCRKTSTQRGIVYKRLIQWGITFLVSVHFITCFWIWIGAIDANEEEPSSWIFQTDSYFTGEELTIYEQVAEPNNTKIYPLYIYSVLYIMTALTTVGYGNHSYQTSLEYCFVIVLEAISTVVQAVIIYIFAGALHFKSNEFDALVDTRLDQMLSWMIKLQNQTEFYISAVQSMYIRHYIKTAFEFDFNLIVEEFPFYQMLSPKMQTELINHLFKDFKDTFTHFLGPCEQGFQNELVIQLYARHYQPGRELIYQNQKANQLFFIQQGQVALQNSQVGRFMVLNKQAVFGDYLLLFDLHSNFQFRTIDDPEFTFQNFNDVPEQLQTRLMCCKASFFTDLCELYPKTHQRLKQLALHKRDIYMHFMRSAQQLKNAKQVNQAVDKKSSLFSKIRMSQFIELEDSQGMEESLELKSMMTQSDEVKSDMRITQEFKMEARLEEAKLKTMKINNRMGNQQLIEIAREREDWVTYEQIEKGMFDYKMTNRRQPADLSRYFLPEERYKATIKDIQNRNKGKMLYSIKLLRVMEQACREIRLQQRKKNKLIPTTKIYREKVIEVVDDFVYFNRKKLDMKDLKGEIMNIESSIETDPELSEESSETSESLPSSLSSQSPSEKSGNSFDKSRSPSPEQHKTSSSIEHLIDPDGTINLELAEELVKDSGKGQQVEIIETKQVTREQLQELLTEQAASCDKEIDEGQLCVTKVGLGSGEVGQNQLFIVDVANGNNHQMSQDLIRQVLHAKTKGSEGNPQLV